MLFYPIPVNAVRIGDKENYFYAIVEKLKIVILIQEIVLLFPILYFLRAYPTPTPSNKAIFHPHATFIISL